MDSLEAYAKRIAAAANLELASGQVFAKVLTDNDDSGRHGVLIPSDAYGFFPHLEITDAALNATQKFNSFDALTGEQVSLAFKYYQRYPERRITRVNPLVNGREQGRRLQVVIRGETSKGLIFYIHDAANEYGSGKFNDLWYLLSRGATPPVPGTHLIVPIRFQGIQIDGPLQELLMKFDAIRGQWHDELRAGDTGIGFTFESLLGIRENNDKTADFQGIELKCKRRRSGEARAIGKLNLFQEAPQWALPASALQRVKELGLRNAKGLWACYSQVTTATNNLGLRLINREGSHKIDLNRHDSFIGHWLYPTLERRLTEKHSRAAFVLAEVRTTASGSKFNYQELIYCEQPSISRFLELVTKNQLVFEFTMSEKNDGQVRNHGYPWRLVGEELLDQLFAVRVKLR